jgi:hypothetical protein
MSAQPREILFEISVRGAYKRVAAIDAATGAEASAQGPVRVPDEDLKKLAVKKLLLQLQSEKK